MTAKASAGATELANAMMDKLLPEPFRTDYKAIDETLAEEAMLIDSHLEPLLRAVEKSKLASELLLRIREHGVGSVSYYDADLAIVAHKELAELAEKWKPGR